LGAAHEFPRHFSVTSGSARDEDRTISRNDLPRIRSSEVSLIAARIQQGKWPTDSQCSRPFDRLLSHVVRNGSNREAWITHARLIDTKV
jgi:hypothetical protein